MGFVAGVDVEGVGDARGGYFYALGVFGGEGAVFEGGGKEVDYGECETLFGVEGGRLDDRISGGGLREPGCAYHDGAGKDELVQEIEWVRRSLITYIRMFAGCWSRVKKDVVFKVSALQSAESSSR